jgi:hypothetical protein
LIAGHYRRMWSVQDWHIEIVQQPARFYVHIADECHERRRECEEELPYP